jgi:hypothetical protein
MNNGKPYKLEIFYNKNQLTEYFYDSNSSLKELKEYLSEKFLLNFNEIELKYDRRILDEDSSLLSTTLITSGTLPKMIENKVKIKIIPQIHLERISHKVTLMPLNISDEEIEKKNKSELKFGIEFDAILTTLQDFKKIIENIFEKKMEELNYKSPCLNIKEENKFECEFYQDPSNEILLFQCKGGLNGEKSDDCFMFNHLKESNYKKDHEFKFYFLIKKSQIALYRRNPKSNEGLKASDSSLIHLEKTGEIILMKTCEKEKKFNVILQTYDKVFKELEVSREMTVLELKEMIENLFKIRKEFQELLYLVYKLNEDSKMLKDYHIRPRGIIFLRGFYFPLVFVDYYKKSLKNMIGLNIAQKVSIIKEELIRRLHLKFENFCLICNGKELNNEKSLIDYNIQKMQTIYLK